MPNIINITWDRFRADCQLLADRQRRSKPIAVYGIPTGGCFVAQQLCQDSRYFRMIDEPIDGSLIVDDLVDSGKTMERFFIQESGKRGVALYRKPESPSNYETVTTLDGWIKFPWEVSHGPEDAVIRLLEWIGENPKREGLIGTPDRVLRAWKEMTTGYQESPKEILSRVFEESYDEVVVVRGIPFNSICEHHMLPFIGEADVGYLPNGKVVGLSKLARLVDCFARRLQIQEKMTRQIADSIQEHLSAKGVAVVVKASHSCMGCRGVKKPGVQMVTSCMLGVFRDKPEARAEFLALTK